MIEVGQVENEHVNGSSNILECLTIASVCAFFCVLITKHITCYLHSKCYRHNLVRVLFYTNSLTAYIRYLLCLKFFGVILFTTIERCTSSREHAVWDSHYTLNLVLHWVHWIASVNLLGLRVLRRVLGLRASGFQWKVTEDRLHWGIL